MIRRSLLAAVACLASLGAFSSTVAVMTAGGGAPTQAQVA